VYLHVLFFLNAGGLWRDEADLVHLPLPRFGSGAKPPHDPAHPSTFVARMVGDGWKYGPWFACLRFTSGCFCYWRFGLPLDDA
jgi:hypothetical protein